MYFIYIYILVIMSILKKTFKNKLSNSIFKNREKK